MSAGMALLIADDDALVQATYKYCFEEAGYRVGLASNGCETIAYLEKNETDAVFLDVFMPDKDGLETLIEIKRRFGHIRVFVMSGGGIGSQYDFLNVATKFGADGVVRKPTSPNVLIAMLRGRPQTG